MVSTLSNLASPATKGKFDKLLFVSPVVLGNLKILWAATVSYFFPFFCVLDRSEGMIGEGRIESRWLRFWL